MSFYRFPTDLAPFRTADSIEEIKRLLRQAFTDVGIPIKRFRGLGSFFRVMLPNLKKKMYIVCSKRYEKQVCLWKMKYKHKIKENEQDPQGEQKSYFQLQIKGSCFEHNHEFSKLQKKELPLQCNIISSYLQKHKYNAVRINSYLKDYSRKITIPLDFFTNFSRRKNMGDTFLDEMSFKHWYQITKSTYDAQIMYYPQNIDHQLMPDIAIVTLKKMFRPCSIHGQVIGIRRLPISINQKTKDYQTYESLLIYQYIPKYGTLFYMFSIFSNNNFLLMSSKTRKIYNLESICDEAMENKSRRVRVNLNIYKIIKVFLNTMGVVTRTFVIEYDQLLIDTIEYTVQKLNQNNQYKNKTGHRLNWIVDPTNYFAKRTTPGYRFCRYIIHMLMSTTSILQYTHLYKQLWQQDISKLTQTMKLQDKNENETEEIGVINNFEKKQLLKKIMTKFHEHHQDFLPFNKEEVLFTGAWFEDQLSTDNVTVIEVALRKKFKQDLGFLRILNFAIKQMCTEVKKYANKVILIDHNCYQSVFPYSFIKSARINMMKKGFYLLVKQTIETNSVNFRYRNKVNPKKKFLKAEDDQEVQFIERNPQLKNFILNQQVAQVKSDLVFVQSKAIYDEHCSYNPIANTDKQKQEESSIYEADSISMFKNIKEVKCKRIYGDERFKTYEQLYPIKLPTLITNQAKLPDYIEFQDKGRLFLCKLVIRTEEQIESMKKREQISSKIHPTHFKYIYVCSCKYQQIKGVPCRHILKICLRYEMAIYPYISSIWRLPFSYVQEYQVHFLLQGSAIPSAGRPKKSRRRARQSITPPRGGPKYHPGLGYAPDYETFFCEEMKMRNNECVLGEGNRIEKL